MSLDRRSGKARFGLAVTPAVGMMMVTSFLVLLGAGTATASAVPVPTATTSSFALLAGSAISNTGASVINGDLGLSPGSTVAGLGSATVNGTQDVADAPAAQAQVDLTTAYDSAAGQGPSSPITKDLGGKTLTPGVYNSASSIGLTGTLTLNGASDPNAVFIFQAGSTLTTASSSQIDLINGAQSCNVFWQVGSAASLGASSSFRGTILALDSVTIGTSVTVDGRVLTQSGSVTLDADTISTPTCATPTVLPTTETASKAPITSSAAIAATESRASVAASKIAAAKVAARLRAFELKATKQRSPVADVIANKSAISASGGGVTIHAVVKGATTCRWTSSPVIKTFNSTVQCKARMSRTALLPQNVLTTKRTFTLSLVTTGTNGTKIGRAEVLESRTRFARLLNWSGYILPSRSKFTAAVDQWTVPTMNCAGMPNATETTFVGIGGALLPKGERSEALLQTGINSSCDDGVQREFGWWEEVPANPDYVVNFTNFTVTPGDSIKGSVFRNDQGKWQTELDDKTTGLSAVSVVGGAWDVVVTSTFAPVGIAQGTSAGLSYFGAHSAEWIVEDPKQDGSLLAFANAGTQDFTSLFTSRLNWTLRAIDGAEMVQKGRTISTPSPPGNKKFSVTHTR